jgi:four helix bundle protein
MEPIMSNEKVRTYRDLKVWKRGIDLARQLYASTRGFPEDERFGLTAQIRRAAVSVPSNIAEGQARRTSKDFIQFLYIAKGSLAELDTQLTLAHELLYIQEDSYQELLESIDALQRMLFSLTSKLGGSK